MSLIKELISKFKKNNQNKFEEKVLMYLREKTRIHSKLYPNIRSFSLDLITNEKIVYGIYDFHNLKVVEEKIFNKIDYKDSICLDVGAHHGNHSIFFSKFFKNVYSFEPNEDNYELLKLNTKKIKNIKIYNIGLSDLEQNVSMERLEYSSGDSKIIENYSKNINNNLNVINAKLVKFDQFINSINFEGKISYIKVDVEGHEQKVFEGMKNTLIKYSPIIHFEQLHDQIKIINNKITTETIEYLSNSGYNYFYQKLYRRKWKYLKSSNRFISFFQKIIETIFYGLPVSESFLSKLNLQFGQNYQLIIASKSQIN